MTEVLTTAAAARSWIQSQRANRQTIGLVPTMGFLHEGHLSLIRRSRQTCDRTVVSIFVNPLQFGPGEDLERYPRDFDRDLSMIQCEGADAVFHPDVTEMYPVPPVTSIEVGAIAEVLCGASRPGHFRGVATVVAKLFHILPADQAFFGQKDAQQLAVIRTMVRDLNFPIQIEACPIVREPDSLAMSSRNVYLTPSQRAHATVLYRSLQLAQNMIHSGTHDVLKVEKAMRAMIEATPEAVIDYARVVNPDSLEKLEQIDSDVLVALAVRFGKTRLIDNMLIAQKR